MSLFNFISKQFKKKEKTISVVPPSQRELKQKLVEVLSKNQLVKLDKLMDYLGDPPNISHIPHDYLHSDDWLAIQKQVEPILVEIEQQKALAAFSSIGLRTTNNGVTGSDSVDWDNSNSDHFQDWTKSPAHLELLSKFSSSLLSKHTYLYTKYDFPTAYRTSDWEEVLNEPQLDSIRRFIQEGYLVRPDLFALIDYKFTVTELKKLCQQRGISASGKKADLIEKLITADELGIQKGVADLEVFTYSGKGKKLADSYLATRHEERHTALSMSLDHLKRKEFRQALMTHALYELNQVFQSGLGVDWQKESVMPSDVDIQTLSIMFEETPTVLRTLDPTKLDRFREFAGFHYLWGNKQELAALLNGIDSISEKFDNLDLAWTLERFAINKRNLISYRKLAKSMEWSHNNYMIKILTCNDERECDECKKLAEQRFPVLGEVPELPFPNCSHACRCGYSLDRQLAD